MECQRCKGCMVNEKAYIPATISCANDIFVWKCIQCGDCVDDVILANRQMQSEGTLPKEGPHKRYDTTSNFPIRMGK